MVIRTRLISSFLISFAVAGLLFITSTFASEDKVIAYYFYGSFRCHTCYKLEEYSKGAIYNNFKDEITKGLLVFKAVNIEEKGNEHFVNEYQLYTKSLVLSKIEGGKEVQYKNLKKIWEYAADKEKFYDYVTNEIRAFLEA